MVAVIIRVAFYTLLERKLLGYFQNRKGPNKPGIAGLLVPFGDAVKLGTKENNHPRWRNNLVYAVVPSLTLMITIVLWGVYPSGYETLTFKYSVLWFICVSSLGVYALLGAGWGSNRKYSMFGAVRAVAQSVSYEVSLAFLVVHWIIFYQFTLMSDKLMSIGPFLFTSIFILLVTTLAETNRTPFDFSEGESELVRGYNTEYRSIPFVFIFLSEYMSIVFISVIVRIIYNITRYYDLFIYVIWWSMIYIWRRGTLPRLRYDQLIRIAWKRYLPLVLRIAGILISA